MPFLARQQAKIFWQLSDSAGPLVTLVNGYMRTSRDFNLLKRKIIERGYQVLTLDNRGTGQSQVLNSFTVNDMAEDIIAIWQQLKITESFVAGFSMGGLIAQALLAKRPDKIIGLSLVSSCSDPKRIESSERSLAKSQAEILRQLSRYVSKDFYQKNNLLLQAMAGDLLKQNQSAQHKQSSLWQSQAIEKFEPCLDLLPKENCPVQVIHGSVDQIIPLEASEDLQKHFLTTRVCILQAKGHLLLAEDFENLYKNLLDFWQRVRDKSKS